ncbi:MobA/MobL family protein [Klebsiella pneumoniae]|jgi:hypothetical protein|uniref:MobA/MobL family protein n=1 Tax=Klebsiella pneumoniae TaxID=573 RepID=UPI0038D0AC72|nr:MobA/MobL family protein [Salmonella enterica]EHU4881298.1 MobA/MobL family protein [Salmonella enterica]EIK1838182.1 MobA/MobL family protein [Salmonella enterica]
MAIARLSMKAGMKGRGADHSAYISREGKYANRLERGERLEATDHGNMPEWAKDNPQQFWLAADAYERKNGTSYREMEIALPRELDSEQREALVRDWTEQELGDKHAYQWAIHVPTAADGGEQPHVHLMFSERQRDGIERDPEQYFKRYNSRNPEAGGARKGYGEHGGQPRTLEQRREELVALRGRWEAKANEHLERAGQRERIDMRSYTAQGKDAIPEKKQLPSEWRDERKRAEILDFRAAKAEQEQAQKDAGKVLYEHNSAVEHYRGVVAAVPEHRLKNSSPDSIALDLREKLVGQRVDSDPAVLAAREQEEKTGKALENARQERDKTRQEAEQQRQEQQRWEEENRMRRWLHDKGIKKDERYTGLQQQREKSEQQAQAAAQKEQQAEMQHRQAVTAREETETDVRQQANEKWFEHHHTAVKEAAAERQRELERQEREQQQAKQAEYQQLIAQQQRQREQEKEQEHTPERQHGRGMSM